MRDRARKMPVLEKQKLARAIMFNNERKERIELLLKHIEQMQRELYILYTQQ